MRILKMAWRNLWRNRRRTLVTIAAMSLGLLAMIVYAGLLEGYLAGMERSILDLEVGDLQVFPADYREDPSLYSVIEDPAALLAPLAEAGMPASGRLLAYGLAAAEESSAGVSLRGVDVGADTRVSRVYEEVVAGRWLDPDAPGEVVLGRRLARTLALEPGGEIAILSLGADESLAVDLFVVRGVLRGISDAVDRSGVYMTSDAFRELMVLPSGVHQIIVRVPEDVELAEAASRVRDVAAGQDVRTWRELLPTLSSLMESTRGLMIAMFLIVYVAIGILILNAMLMAVFERIREFGVLKAVGASPVDVLELILAETALQTALAVAIGIGLAIPAILYLQVVGIDLESLAGVSVMGIAMDPVWRAKVEPVVFTAPIVTLVSVVAVSVVYPALKAALIRPVDAMRHR